MLRTKIAAIAVAATAVIGVGAGVAGTAHAATGVTAVTHITNRADSGNGGNWAYDNFTRTLTVSENTDQTGVAAGFIKYTATVSDKGSFTTIQGSPTPNQSTTGIKIAHAVKGTLNGTDTFTVVAPSTDALTGVVPATENDNFGAAQVSTSVWPLQAFASTDGTTVTQGPWSWTYTTPAGEIWTDSSTNGDGNTINDGNITGLVTRPVVPVLYDGSANYVAATRENVNFMQRNKASWDHFTIVGPGAINGHQGWVNGKIGLNTAYYTGLLANHGYTVLYQPVTGKGSTRPIPGSHVGYVYFQTNQPSTAVSTN